MRLRPINDRIIVRRSATEEKGLLAIPDQFKRKENKGEILAVGGGLLLSDGTRVPLSVKVGEVVHFQPKVMEVDINGETYLVLTEQDILFVEGEESVQKTDTEAV